MRIGIIDSGIDLEYLNNPNNHIRGIYYISGENKNQGSISKCFEIFEQKDIVSMEDKVDHGSKVIRIIETQIKNYPHEYFIAKIFSEKNNASDSDLVHALEWLIDNNVDCINLSLGTTAGVFVQVLQELCKKALFKGIRMFCAGSLEITYPAWFPEVITVVDKNLSEQIPNLFHHFKKHDYMVIPFNEIHYEKNGDIIKTDISTSFATPMAMAIWIKKQFGRLLIPIVPLLMLSHVDAKIVPGIRLLQTPHDIFLIECKEMSFLNLELLDQAQNMNDIKAIKGPFKISTLYLSQTNPYPNFTFKREKHKGYFQVLFVDPIYHNILARTDIKQGL